MCKKTYFPNTVAFSQDIMILTKTNPELWMGCPMGCDENTGKCKDDVYDLGFALRSSAVCNLNRGRIVVKNRDDSSSDYLFDCSDYTFTYCNAGVDESTRMCKTSGPRGDSPDDRTIAPVGANPTISPEIKAVPPVPPDPYVGWLKLTGEDLLNPSLYNDRFESDFAKSSIDMSKEVTDYQVWYKKNVVNEKKLKDYVAFLQIDSTGKVVQSKCHGDNADNLFNFKNIDNNYLLDKCQNAIFMYYQNFTEGDNPLYLKAIVDTVPNKNRYIPLKRETSTFKLFPGKKEDDKFNKFKLYVGPVLNLDGIVEADLAKFGNSTLDYEKVLRTLYISEFGSDQ